MMALVLTLSIVLVLSLREASPSSKTARSAAAAETVKCSSFRESLHAYPWLLGETTVTGLSNQLTAVYSYIPAALLFNTNLLLGCMYSRKNFEITMRQFDAEPNGKKVMSFRDFFDWDVFQQGWFDVSGGRPIMDMADLLISQPTSNKNSNGIINVPAATNNSNNSNVANTNALLLPLTLPGLQPQQQPQYEYCIPPIGSSIYKDVKRTRWRSASDDELLAMANASNVGVPLQAPSILRFASKFKMMALYNFERGNATTTRALPAEALVRRGKGKEERELKQKALFASVNGGMGGSRGGGGGDGMDMDMDDTSTSKKYYPSLLEKIHHSVRPSQTVQTAVEAVLAALPRDFWAAHIRVEGDVIRFFSTSSGGGIVYKNRLKAQREKQRKIKNAYVMLGEEGTIYSYRLVCPNMVTGGGGGGGIFSTSSSSNTSNSAPPVTQYLYLYMDLSSYQQQLVNQSVDEDALFYDELPNVITAILQSQSVRDHFCTTNTNKNHHHSSATATPAGIVGTGAGSGTTTTTTTNTIGASPSSRSIHLELRSSSGSKSSSSSSSSRSSTLGSAISSSLPPLYVASGIFRSGNKSFLQRRSRVIIDILKNIGFPRVYTRFELLESGEVSGDIQQDIDSDTSTNTNSTAASTSISSFTTNTLVNGSSHNYTTTKLLLATELAAYVDLEVAKRAKSFIPAHMSSSFSYMVQRLVELDRGQMHTDVQPPHRQFRNFFF